MNSILAIESLDFGLFMDQLTSNVLFNIALLLTLGIIGGKLAELAKLPKVTGYIIMGIIIGPNALGVLSHDVLYSFKAFKILALGFIGFNIGMELNFKRLRTTGKEVLFVTFAQVFVTFILVAGAVYLFVDEYKWTYALIFGAIAIVTTPAPILVCIKSYHVKGRLTSLLCPMVALDDAFGIIVFAFILPIAIYLAGHSGEVISAGNLFLGPMLEIGLSVIIGSIIGLIIIFILNHFKKGDDLSLLLIVVVGLFFGIGIGYAAEMSAILLPLTIGVLVSNKLDPDYMYKIKGITDAIILPLLLVFFTLSGAELDVALLPRLGELGLIYIFVRVIGKIIGSSVSTKVMKERKEVVRYLGVTLIPQGGVAIDMAILAEFRFLQLATELDNPHFAVIGSTILTIILAATVIYKIFGEIIVKWAFKKAGEMPENDQDYIEHQHLA